MGHDHTLRPSLLRMKSDANLPRINQLEQLRIAVQPR